jgi:lipopolysaccharide export LptBFGC system permease protein LptF
LQDVPWGFRKMLNWIAKEYNNPPVLITENGFSDYGDLNDTVRVDYIIVSVSNSGLLASSLRNLCVRINTSIFLTKIFVQNRGYKTQC